MKSVVIWLAAVTILACTRNEISSQDASMANTVCGIEECNGLDDDCDGTVDENAMGLGRRCSEGVGVCRQEGTMGCFGGEFVCNVTGIMPVVETCDGADNDCDGSTDEGYSLSDDVENCGGCGVICSFPNAAPKCAAGQCAIDQCIPGFVDLNEAPGCEYECTLADVSDEMCDGRDNDCNGRVDEGLDLPCGQDVGTCTVGIRACVDGEYQDCNATPPAAEVCDGLDNNCDGIVDEAFDLTTDAAHCGGCGLACDGANATVNCLDGLCVIVDCDEHHADLDEEAENGCEHACSPQPDGQEICDQLDNDCDGRIDEGIDLQRDVLNCGGCNTTCTVGGEIQQCVNGECRINNCPAGTADTDRNYDNGCECEIRGEDCNGFDDDCDGIADEALANAGCGSPVGVCELGMRTCSDGVWGRCIGAVGPQDETCNGNDDDCDGEVDEQEQEELCDGIDNDCDGTVDETFANLQLECDLQLPGVCALGRTLCRQGEEACVQTFQASPEVCDGADNDCDGQVDEHIPNGATCCETLSVPGQVPCNSAPIGTIVPAGMVYIPPGSFIMGGDPDVLVGNDVADFELGPHRVTITRGFFMQTHEVTLRDWSVAFPNLGKEPNCVIQAEGLGHCPVYGATWYDAIEYANRLSAAHILDQCYQALVGCGGTEGDGLNCLGEQIWAGDLDCSGYRLPTEAEWALAVRAGTSTTYYFGDDDAQVARAAWYIDNAGDGPRSVGALLPNAWGLYDMYGNLDEWVFDHYNIFGEDALVDPVVLEIQNERTARVLRGGSYDGPLSGLRSTARQFAVPGEHIPSFGVRLVRGLP